MRQSGVSTRRYFRSVHRNIPEPRLARGSVIVTENISGPLASTTFSARSALLARSAFSALIVAILLGSSIVAPEAIAKKAKSKSPTTTIEVIKGPADAVSVKEVAAAAKAQALIDGTRLGAVVGNPTCAAPTKTTPGLVIQCLVPFGTNPIPYLVAIGTGSNGTGSNGTGPILTARSTFPLVRSSDLVLAAGDNNAVCGPAGVQSLPVSTVISCTIKSKKSSTTVDVQVADQAGSVKRL